MSINIQRVPVRNYGIKKNEKKNEQKKFQGSFLFFRFRSFDVYFEEYENILQLNNQVEKNNTEKYTTGNSYCHPRLKNKKQNDGLSDITRILFFT